MGDVWLGPNAGYGEAVMADSGIDSWPPRTVIMHELTPTHKTGSVLDYEWTDYMELLPEQIAWRATAKALNLDPDEPDLQNPEIEGPILRKLISAVTSVIQFSYKTETIVTPTTDQVMEIFGAAMLSGNPTVYLDKLVSPQSET